MYYTENFSLLFCFYNKIRHFLGLIRTTSGSYKSGKQVFKINRILLSQNDCDSKYMQKETLNTS